MPERQEYNMEAVAVPAIEGGEFSFQLSERRNARLFREALGSIGREKTRTVEQLFGRKTII